MKLQFLRRGEMEKIGVIIGGLLGIMMLHTFPGLVIGAVIGYLVAAFFAMQKRMGLLEKKVDELKRMNVKEDQKNRESETIADETVFFDVKPTESSVPFKDINTSPPEYAVKMQEPASYSDKHTPVEPSFKKKPEPEGEYEIVEALKGFMSSGSLMVKAGVVVLFFGVSFLLKYAAEHGFLPIEIRLATTALAGVAMLVVGWRLRGSRANYALVLQGGGVGILYLTVFAALRLYALISPTFAFVILVLICASATALALLQNSGALAVLGVSGGFLAPVLASTGGGSHIVLFGYYALLNAGIIVISWFKNWRSLNHIGFFFTFIVGTAWGYKFYQPEYFSTTGPFLVIFFLMYVAVTMLSALRTQREPDKYIDWTLIFGTPIMTAALQAMMVRNYQYGMAWSALALGLFYISLAWVLFIKVSGRLLMIAEAFISLGVVFCTLAIPLAFNGRWTSVAWALEGAAIVWVGMRQHRTRARVFGMLMQFAAGIAFLKELSLGAVGLPVLNGFYLGCFLLSISGLFISFYIYRHRDEVEEWEFYTGIVIAVTGLLWWFCGGLNEINRYVITEYRMGSALVFIAFSCGICSYSEKRLVWPLLAFPSLLLLPAMFIIANGIWNSAGHPSSGGGFAAWPVAFSLYLWILYHHDEVWSDVLMLLHAGSLWLFAGLSTWELNWWTHQWLGSQGVWELTAWAFVPALCMLGISVFGHRIAWPFRKHLDTYIVFGAGPLALFVWLWSIYVNISSKGDPWPLPYLPFLNALDVTVCFVLLALRIWFVRFCTAKADIPFSLSQKDMVFLCAGTVFIWLNAIVVRTIHYWGGVDFSFKAMFGSILLQATISVFWSLLALMVMVFATRKGLRTVWWTGSGLMALVVFKLFTVDLSKTGTLERIISFVAVGILLLIIGYFSPVPPKMEVKR